MRPAKLGNTVYRDFPLDQLLDAIDWNPFFQVSTRPHRAIAWSERRVPPEHGSCRRRTVFAARAAHSALAA